MTGIQIVLGAFAGAALGAGITALRLWLLRRLTGADPAFATRTPTVPPSAEVLEAERRVALEHRRP